MMERLEGLGWSYDFDTFITYWKFVNDIKIVVSKHTNDSNWKVTLSDEYDEIVVNENATFDWVIKLTNILTDTKD